MQDASMRVDNAPVTIKGQAFQAADPIRQRDRGTSRMYHAARGGISNWWGRVDNIWYRIMNAPFRLVLTNYTVDEWCITPGVETTLRIALQLRAVDGADGAGDAARV